METIGSRLDITQIFCEVDDLCHQFERLWHWQGQLPLILSEKRSLSWLHLSEVMAIVIAFHDSGFDIFCGFLYSASAAPLEKSLSQSGQLHPLCGVDALEPDSIYAAICTRLRARSLATTLLT